MTSSKSTKRALVSSALAIIMCVAMLIGATFAWFTDTASTGVNKIQAGNLDIKVEYAKEKMNDDGTLAGELTDWTPIDNATNVFDPNALWEPGRTEYVVFRITNNGNLALKYKLSLETLAQKPGTNKANEQFYLADYLCASAKVNAGPGEVGSGVSTLGAFMTKLNDLAVAGVQNVLDPEYHPLTDATVNGTLLPGKTNCVPMAIWMPTSVGNEANAISPDKAATIDFGINVVATQDTVESDSFNNQYDADAPLDFEPVSTADELKAAATNGKNVQLTQDVTLTDALTFDNAVTIDLNGKTLTSSLNSNGYSLVTKANATIVNGTYKGTGTARGIAACGNLKMRNVTVDVAGQVGVACSAADRQYTIEDSTIKGGYALCNFNNNATINVSNSTLEGTTTGFYHNGSNSGLNLTVTGTKINAGNNGTDATGVYISGSTATRDAGGYQKASFTDCTVKGNAAIEVKYTDLTLNNCTVTATVPAANASYTQNNNGSTTNGFAVVSTDNATNNTMPKPEGTITINGGSYTGLIGLHSFAKIATDFPGFVDASYVINP